MRLPITKIIEAQIVKQIQEEEDKLFMDIFRRTCSQNGLQPGQQMLPRLKGPV